MFTEQSTERADARVAPSHLDRAFAEHSRAIEELYTRFMSEIAASAEPETGGRRHRRPDTEQMTAVTGRPPVPNGLPVAA